MKDLICLISIRLLPARCNAATLTVTAERPPVGGHGAVAGEALPQLQAHSLVVAGVLCAGGAGTCGVFTADGAGAFFFSPPPYFSHTSSILVNRNK